jgi:hypothetical protein
MLADDFLLDGRGPGRATADERFRCPPEGYKPQTFIDPVALPIAAKPIFSRVIYLYANLL